MFSRTSFDDVSRARMTTVASIMFELFPIGDFDCEFYVGTSTKRNNLRINRIYDGVEAKTRKSQASFQIIYSYARLAEHKT